MKERHYEIRDGKYLSLKPYGKPKGVRTRSLGAGYGKEEIIDRIRIEKKAERGYRVYGDTESIRLLFIRKRYGNASFHLTPFQRSFYLRWKNTCFIRRPDFRDAWKYRKDVLSLQDISDRIRYLLEQEITTPEEAMSRKADLEKERKAARSAFNAAKRKLYKDPLCVLVRKRDALLHGQKTEEDLSGKLSETEEAIRKIMPISDAEDYFVERKTKYDQCREMLRDLKKEIRLVDGIVEETQAYLSLRQDIKQEQIKPDGPKIKPDMVYQKKREEVRRG